MIPNFWLSVAFLMSRIGVFQAAVQCSTAENSIGGMFLRGHTFKTSKVGWPAGCYLMCEEEVKCQSYNFVIGHKVCELNNRTKEARPEDFKPDQTRFYMKRAKNRGTLQFSFPDCPSFTMHPFEMLPYIAGGILWFGLRFHLPMEGGRMPRKWGVIKLRFCTLGFSTQYCSCRDRFSQPFEKMH